MLNFFKNTFSHLYNSVTAKLSSLFARSSIDVHTIQELQKIFLQADMGVITTNILIERIKKAVAQKPEFSGQELQAVVQQELINILHLSAQQQPAIYIVTGINGSGKTTFVAKLAHYYKQRGKKVLLAAADTFRAAAQEQLHHWADKAHVDIVIGKANQDPGSVVFTACQKFNTESYDILIIDTAGRLQTNSNLMHELEKLKRIVQKQLPQKNISTLLTIDAMLGQNSLEQARLFHKALHLDSIVLTKMDGTGKGGIIFAINHELNVPVSYISYGEAIDTLALFDAQQFVQDLITK